MPFYLLCDNLKNDENDSHEAHVQNEKRSQNRRASKSQIVNFSVRVSSSQKTKLVAHGKTTLQIRQKQSLDSYEVECVRLLKSHKSFLEATEHNGANEKKNAPSSGSCFRKKEVKQTLKNNQSLLRSSRCKLMTHCDKLSLEVSLC